MVGMKIGVRPNMEQVGVQVVVTNGLKFLSRSWISLERAEILSRSCSLSTITAVLSLTIVSWLS